MKQWIWLLAVAPLFWGCFGPSADNSEKTLALCTDGIDNDANGDMDCEDASCAAFCSTTSVDDVIIAPARYSFGIQPSTVNMTRQYKLFNAWLANHYEEDATQNYARIRFQSQSNTDIQGRTIGRNHTVSEGIAYGMLILVAMDTLPNRFNRLWNYYVAHEDNQGLMHWMTYLFEIDPAQSGSASDADLDAATALLLAQKKWGDAAGTTMYFDASNILMESIRNYEIDVNSHLAPGDGWGNSGVTVKNPGYTATGAMKAFALASGNTTWNTLVAANYDQVAQCQNPKTGVIPDWCYSSETTTADTNTYGRSHDFYMEAVRMPWRLALDYYWYGSAEAKALNKKFADYLYSATAGDLTRLSQGYTWAGMQMTGTATPMFLGTYALLFSQDPTKQAQVDNLYASTIAKDIPGYYESSLQLIFTSTLAGLLPRPY